jgi:hypothetical protein
MDDSAKAPLLGRAFAAFMRSEITYLQFTRIAAAVDRAHLADLNEFAAHANPAFVRLEWGFRLAAIGLLRLTNVSEIGYSEAEVYEANETGDLVLKFVLASATGGSQSTETLSGNN